MMLVWLLSILQGVLISGGSWRGVRLGPPLLDLRDHGITAHAAIGSASFRRPLASYTRPDSMGQIEQLMAQAVADNGLRLDQETATNGDCGPDAILKNILRLKLTCPRAQQLRKHYQKHGREAALRALRIMLLIWIREHANTEVVPDVTISAWVQMEGYASLEEYMATMRVPRTWVDTPMMLAASGVFDMQMVCWVGPGEPELIIAPEHAASNKNLPVALIANCGNIHYYAVEPDVAADQPTDLSSAVDMTGDVLLAKMCMAQSSENQEDLTRNEEPRWSVQPAAEAPQDPLVENTFALCRCLQKWSSFDVPTQELMDILKQQKHADATDMASNTLQALQWRDAYKLCQWEELERQSGVDREHVYGVAKRSVAQANMAHGRFNISSLARFPTSSTWRKCFRTSPRRVRSGAPSTHASIPFGLLLKLSCVGGSCGTAFPSQTGHGG